MLYTKREIIYVYNKQERTKYRPLRGAECDVLLKRITIITSVIGPLLFVIFINDLPDVIKKTHIFLFADDMKLVNPIYNEESCNNLQKDLTSAEKWTETSLLKFHPDKCCNMRTGRFSIRNDGYTMGKDPKTINKAETVKDIGVTFDSSLNFEAHMSEKINKANSMMGIIRSTHF